MPLIKMQTSVKCSDEQKRSLVLELSKLCSHCTKKPENYVQAIIEDDAVIAFAGKIANSAFIEVRGIGGLTPSVNRELSAAISRTLKEKLKIDPSEVYINFTEVSGSNWGCNGSTFG
jgi:phenylpyruvate tautomerase